MYALILWMRSKTTSIVTEEQLCLSKAEEVTSVRYDVNNRLYRAKIIKKSDDSDYLSCLRVSTTGEILRKDKSQSSTIAIADQGHLKKAEKEKAKKKSESSHSAQRKMMNRKSIISDDSDEEKEKDEDSDGVTNPKKRKLVNETGEKAEKTFSSDLTAAEPSTLELAAQLPTSAFIAQPSTSSLTALQQTTSAAAGQPSTSVSGEVQLSTSASTAVQQSTSVEKEKIAELQRQLQEALRKLNENKENSSIPAPCVAVDTSTAEGRNAVAGEDPLLTCRRPGNGRVLVCQNYNIWIDQGDLMYIQRYIHNPKEMTRQLLKYLVGEENLKNMCAGASLGFMEVPRPRSLRGPP